MKCSNVLDKMPKRIQPKAKDMLHQIWMAASRADAETAFQAFVEMFEPKYPKAVECLKKDRDMLLTFYDFPAEHWIHIRMTNPIESTFATSRLKHRKTKGSGSRKACLAMMFKLMESASKTWQALIRRNIDPGRHRRNSVRGWRTKKRRLKYPHPQDLTISRDRCITIHDH